MWLFDTMHLLTVDSSSVPVVNMDGGARDAFSRADNSAPMTRGCDEQPASAFGSHREGALTRAYVSEMYQSTARQVIRRRPVGVVQFASSQLSGIGQHKVDRCGLTITAAIRIWVQEVGGSNPPSPTM